MEKYILTKTQKGKKYLYEVKDENGNVVSKRTSTRDYVACSVSGEFYFGRLDLVGKEITESDWQGRKNGLIIQRPYIWQTVRRH